MPPVLKLSGRVIETELQANRPWLAPAAFPACVWGNHLLPPCLSFLIV